MGEDFDFAINGLEADAQFLRSLGLVAMVPIQGVLGSLSWVWKKTCGTEKVVFVKYPTIKNIKTRLYKRSSWQRI